MLQDVKVSEFVLSNELVSMALAMVSENRDVNVIQNELFTDLGNELYLMPPSKYLRLGVLPAPANGWFGPVSILLGFLKERCFGRKHLGESVHFPASPVYLCLKLGTHWSSALRCLADSCQHVALCLSVTSSSLHCTRVGREGPGTQVP